MTTIAFNWTSDAPTRPDVYSTRRGSSKYITLRYWDGSRWWSLEWGRGRNGKGELFTWPRHSVTRRPRWVREYGASLRVINVGQDDIQWGVQVTVFDDREVLEYLVKTRRLRADWQTAFQEEMRMVAEAKP
jgi:hypothetical protein